MVFQFSNRDRAALDPALPPAVLVAALDGVRDAVVVCDAQGRVRWCNRTFGLHCNRDRGDLAGLVLDDLLRCVDDAGNTIDGDPLWTAVRSRSTGTGRVQPSWAEPTDPWLVTWTRPMASGGMVVLHVWAGVGRLPCPRDDAGGGRPQPQVTPAPNAPSEPLPGPAPATGHTPGLRDQSPIAPSPPRAPGAPLRVLLAEDNLVNQQVARLMLQRLGYQATVVEDGLTVLHCLERTHYDLILMDVEMPRMDGLTAARTIVNQGQGDRGPYIVALTAYALPGDRERCLAAGMDDYITKPLREETLMAVLARAAQRAMAPPRPVPQPIAAIAPSAPPVPPNRAHIPTQTQGQAQPPGQTPEQEIATAIAAIAQQPTLEIAVLNDLKRMAGQRAAALLATIAQQYGEDSPKRLNDVATAIASNDAEHLRKAAHSLRSSSANLGALRLAALAELVENQARQGKTYEIHDLLPKLREEYEKVMERLPSAIEE